MSRETLKKISKQGIIKNTSGIAVGKDDAQRGVTDTTHSPVGGGSGTYRRKIMELLKTKYLDQKGRLEDLRGYL